MKAKSTSKKPKAQTERAKPRSVQRVVRTPKPITLTEHMRLGKLAFTKSNHKWKRDEDGKIDWFATGGGYHNGPECVRCGYSRCVHCNCGDQIPRCPNGEVSEPAASGQRKTNAAQSAGSLH